MMYGLMVCELDGSIEDMESKYDTMPSKEFCGSSYAEWFTTIKERDERKKYVQETIRRYKR